MRLQHVWAVLSFSAVLCETDGRLVRETLSSAAFRKILFANSSFTFVRKMWFLFKVSKVTGLEALLSRRQTSEKQMWSLCICRNLHLLDKSNINTNYHHQQHCLSWIQIKCVVCFYVTGAAPCDHDWFTVYRTSSLTPVVSSLKINQLSHWFSPRPCVLHRHSTGALGLMSPSLCTLGILNCLFWRQTQCLFMEHVLFLCRCLWSH